MATCAALVILIRTEIQMMDMDGNETQLMQLINVLTDKVDST